ncbi:MAG: type 4a pilus biogenesis protein PilO [Candidatus Omnitrophica bacterium]|nr:type 4a pilus biogenesis protein PilO [Candidatus Omnitrophota bacterium]
MFSINFSQKEKVGLLIAVAFMSLALLDRLMINPINNNIKRIDRETKISEKRLTMALRNVDQKQVLAQEYRRYVKHQSNGPDEEKITAMLTTIEDLARESEISLLDIKPLSPKNIDFSKQYSIAVEAEGDMDHLINFLYKLHGSSQLLRVETLHLNLKDKNSNAVKASILITKVTVP